MPAELTELLSQVAQQRAAVHAMRPAAQARPWFRVEKKADKPKTADIWIYDTIGPSFFDESTDAKSFARDLAALDVDQILLHINSPGGDFFDGLAIYNGLVDHPARVVSVVDGLAASAASFIFQAGDVRKVNRAGQVMIHDAAGLVVGNAEDMSAMVDTLDSISDSIAGIYASRGGGTVADWRAAMKSETWYTAGEAVTAGLADEAVDEAPPEPPVRNSWDLAIFNYAGRQAAPPPVIPSVTARTQTPAPVAEDSTPPIREGAAGMPDAAKLREALGLKADASDQEVTAAFAAAGFTAAADPPPTNPPNPNPPAPTGPPADSPADPSDPDAPLPPQQVTASGRVKVVDTAVWEKLNEQAGKVELLIQERQREKRDQVIADAMRAGKFGPTEKEPYQKLWDQAPKATEDLIASLTPNRIAVSASGYVAGLDPDEAAEDAVFDELFPPEMRYGNRGVGSRG